MERELVIVLDFGGQYNQLIARRVRECNVYCEVHPYTMSLEEIRERNPKGIFLQAALTAYTVMILLPVIKRFLKWEFRYWVSATAPS